MLTAFGSFTHSDSPGGRAQSKQAFRQLDAAVGRLAVKLPQGDLAPQAAKVGCIGYRLTASPWPAFVAQLF